MLRSGTNRPISAQESRNSPGVCSADVLVSPDDSPTAPGREQPLDIASLVAFDCATDNRKPYDFGGRQLNETNHCAPQKGARRRRRSIFLSRRRVDASRPTIFQQVRGSGTTKLSADSRKVSTPTNHK